MILAGGEGRRLRPLPRVIAGDDRPKQFCRIDPEAPLSPRENHRWLRERYGH